MENVGQAEEGKGVKGGKEVKDQEGRSEEVEILPQDDVNSSSTSIQRDEGESQGQGKGEGQAEELELATSNTEEGGSDSPHQGTTPRPTLLIRKTTDGSGDSTYTVSSGNNNSAPQGQEEVSKPLPQAKPPTSGGKPSGKGALAPPGSGMNPVKRRPGRPVGSGMGSYKRRRMVSEAVPEVRVSSRQSTSIFKHDVTGGIGSASGSTQDNSPYIYTTAIRTSQLQGETGKGKKAASGSHKKKSHSKGKGKSFNKKEKDPLSNIDPLTGKRRYKKRKKLNEEKKDTLFEELISCAESENEPAVAATAATTTEKEPKFHLSDNGVWRPTDDLRLIVNMEATGDLETVYYGVKFSCFFTYKEMEDRWRKLLYDQKASLVSQNAINTLHPDVKAKIYYESLFSDEEEQLLSKIKVPPDSNPELKLFQAVLDENPQTFNKYRTAKSLFAHWLDMRDFHLLPNQSVLDYNPALSFEDFEEATCNNEEPSDDEIENEAVLLELKTAERNLHRRMRTADDEVNGWLSVTGQILEDAIINNAMLPLPASEFDSKTFAVLRGKEVYYGMTSREIILGRSTKDCKVDADLTEEGASKKVSRKQAIIRLNPMGRFIIINRGKRPIFVDRKTVPFKCAAALHDQCVIQIAHICLVFYINEDLVTKVLESDVKNEIYTSFKHLQDSEEQPVGSRATTISLKANSSSYAFPPASTSATLGSNSATGSTSYNNNTETPGDTEGHFVPICQPPASYVTVS